MLQLDFSTVPRLETDRLVLRQITEGDLPELHQLRSNQQAMEFLSRPRTTCEQDARDLLHELEVSQVGGTGVTWCMSLQQESTKLIGIVGLYRISKANHRGEVGYTLMPEHWGQGLMSEATQRLLGYTFDQLGFHSLEAHTDPRNENSKRLLERNGFRFVGMFRDCLLFEGSYVSSDVYELLKSDWKQR